MYTFWVFEKTFYFFKLELDFRQQVLFFVSTGRVTVHEADEN